ncbi:MAG: hypothetical protein U1E65_17430 [Myxococcota bacterium]
MRHTAFFAAFWVASVSVPALADGEDSTVARGGPGFPIGTKSRIHTNFDAATGFDSNPPRLEAVPANGVADFKAQFRPSINVDVPGESASFGLQSTLMIEQFFGTSGAKSDTRVGGHVGLSLNLGSDTSVVGFELNDTLSRTPTFFNDLGQGLATDEINLVQWRNKGLTNLVLRPGGGALEFRLGYGNDLAFYDRAPTSQRHLINFEAKLRFLPKTALVFGGDFSFFTPQANGGFLTTGKKSTPLSLTIGLQGQITTLLTATARVGYGDSLVWQGDFFGASANTSVRTFIANLHLGYAFTPTSEVDLGYDRTVKPVILNDAYTSDAISARILWGIMGGRLTLGAFGSLEFRTFDARGSQRNVIGDFRAEYWFLDWLRGLVDYQVINQYADSASALALSLPVYTRHQVLLGVGFYY